MAELITGVVRSRVVKDDLPYRAVVPSGFDPENENSVLYLLHGVFGDHTNWSELTTLVEDADKRRYVIVTPEGRDSWYVDAYAGNAGYEAAYLNELFPHIDREFNIKGGRAIAGLSMGGYAAIKFALRRPDLFKCAISTSGAFHAPALSDENAGPGWSELRESVVKAFGPPNSETRKQNDIFELIRRFESSATPAPFIAIDCGLEDEFLAVNRELHEAMERASIAHSYGEFKGGHDWEYWQSRLADILAIADEFLG